MIQNSPGIKSPYLTECDWSVYTKVYESFKTHVFLSASDMPIISEAQLVDVNDNLLKLDSSLCVEIDFSMFWNL